jgi:hypothetical protein
VAEEGIYFLTANPSLGGEDWSTGLLNLETGEVTQIVNQQSPHYHSSLTVSPDSHWILYAERSREDADIMLVENFR